MEDSITEYEHKLLESAKVAAQEAGVILKEGYYSSRRVDFERKGVSDFVTFYDRAAEKCIIKRIRGLFPEIAFMGEESGSTAGNMSDYTVIIDPIDGTNNFIHGVPHFSVSIAVTKGSEILLGLVYQPLLNEMLWAARGSGAYINEKRLRLQSARPLSEMIVSTCLPYHGKGDCLTSLNHLKKLMPIVAGIRSPGSAALEIAYTSIERFDAFWSQGAELDFWDIAAGILIAREAGCKVTDLNGDPSPSQWKSLLSAHPERHEELLSYLG
ncbi:inositol monophosphatase family protein [Halomonas meridiana]|uniref:inositol monophosphatase family protein n=1 Tax=Vreelandella aquamarina TaxID=77097 RepID=UPI00273AEC32|nr:inositol monophosphatase family protein [Halomonas meridiana]MDP4557620.1 inositol monophosphatase family protein [Halomonas meridiana]